MYVSSYSKLVPVNPQTAKFKRYGLNDSKTQLELSNKRTINKNASMFDF